jgi:hypothetical protein
MRRASTAAALCCLRHGSQSSLPHHRDTDDALVGRLSAEERSAGWPDGECPRERA